jgi:hypothetical protein
VHVAITAATTTRRTTASYAVIDELPTTAPGKIRRGRLVP